MPIYTPGQVAGFCGVAATTVSGWIDDGILVGFRLPGGARRITRAALLDFLRRHDMPLELAPSEEEAAKEGAVAAP